MCSPEKYHLIITTIIIIISNNILCANNGDAAISITLASWRTLYAYPRYRRQLEYIRSDIMFA